MLISKCQIFSVVNFKFNCFLNFFYICILCLFLDMSSYYWTFFPLSGSKSIIATMTLISSKISAMLIIHHILFLSQTSTNES